MDDQLRREAVREHVKKKFQGKESLVSKTRLHYPDSVEREYKRVTNAYMRLLSKIIKEDLIPEIRKAANAELDADYYRQDGVNDLVRRLSDAFDLCTEKLVRQMSAFKLRERIEEIASLASKFSIREWKQAVHDTLGIDLLDDYYAGKFYKQVLAEWTGQNVDLITTIPKESLGRMKVIVLEGYRNGRSTTSLVKEIQSEYGVTRSHAQMIARDQMAKLNAQITEKQQRDAGVTQYIWSTSKDSRVRECHAALDGQTFSYDDPPEMWYSTKAGIVYTGRRCNPGQDYCCRCCALPVFNFEKLDL